MLIIIQMQGYNLPSKLPLFELALVCLGLRKHLQMNATWGKGVDGALH